MASEAGRSSNILPVLGLLALTFTILEGCSTAWTNVKVKYAPPWAGEFSVPLSVSQLGKEYEFLNKHDDFPLVSLYVYKGDPRLQLMYDDHKKICGLRVAYVKDQINKKTPQGETFPYSYDDKPIFKPGSALGIEFYYIDVFFINPDVLKTGGPEHRDEAVGTGVYINMDGKSWTEMPRKQEDTEKTKFTKQGCFPGMGKHYFYDMTPEMKCENHNPVFLLYVQGQLIGLGLVPFGTFDSNFGRPWFEDPPKSVIKKIVPNAPQCLAEWVGKYGTTSLHIYFRPFNGLNCVLPFEF